MQLFWELSALPPASADLDLTLSPWLLARMFGLPLCSQVKAAEARSQAEKELLVLMLGHPALWVYRNKTVSMA